MKGSIRVAGALGGVMLATLAAAARLPTSTLAVKVLSVSQEYVHRETAAVGNQVFETTGFVAQVRIENIVRSDLDLVPGRIIKIHYKIRTARPLPFRFRDVPLRPGEDTTLTVMGAKDGYERL